MSKRMPRRDAIGGRRPQEDRAEAVAGERRDVALGPDLRLAVGGDRIERAGLVDHVLAGAGRSCCTTTRTGSASTPACLASFGEADAGAMIDVVGEFGVEIAERIVRQRRQMDDRVEAVEIGRRHVAHVLADAPAPATICAAGRIGAALIEIAVAADDLVARLQQHRHHHGADVALMAGDQNTHARPHGWQKLHHQTIAATAGHQKTSTRRSRLPLLREFSRPRVFPRIHHVAGMSPPSSERTGGACGETGARR